jgi:hypothetical protein
MELDVRATRPRSRCRPTEQRSWRGQWPGICLPGHDLPSAICAVAARRDMRELTKGLLELRAQVEKLLESEREHSG